MIGDIISNKKLNPIVTELFIKGRKLIIYLVFITVPKYTRLNCRHQFIIKIPNKWEFKQIASQNSSDIDFQNYINFYKNVMQNHLFGYW